MKILFACLFGLLIETLPMRVGALEPSDDRLKIAENSDFNTFIYESSITKLPPDWKKVWVLKNFKSKDPKKLPHIQSNRSNIVFDCVGETYYTLSSVNYAELDARSKPMLQISSGFNSREFPVESNLEYKIIFQKLCSK